MDLTMNSSQESTDSNSSAEGSEGQVSKNLNRCNLCTYTTNRRSNLVRHMFTMHQTNVDHGLECCEMRFLSKSHLKEHKKVYHSDGYHCKVCNRPFCRRALLKRHMNVHSGRKEFSCDRCMYATSHKSNLERHFQRLHGPASEQANKSRTSDEVASYQERDSVHDYESSLEETKCSKPRLCNQLYQCMSCDNSFHSQIEHSRHTEICATSQTTITDESVLLAALALTQLKYGSPLSYQCSPVYQ